MTQYLRLAELLEEAAQRLREAHAALNGLSVDQDLFSMDGFSNLSVRCRRSLRDNGGYYPAIRTLRELCDKTADELLERRNFGTHTLGEVREFLARHGHHLAGEK